MAVAYKTAGSVNEVPSGTSNPVPVPALAAGDYAILVVLATVSTITVPAGWTQVGTPQAGTGIYIHIWWSYATSGASATTVSVTHASGLSRGRVLVYDGADNSAPTKTTGGNSTVARIDSAAISATGFYVVVAVLSAIRTFTSTSINGSLTATLSNRVWESIPAAAPSASHAVLDLLATAAGGGTGRWNYSGGNANTLTATLLIPEASGLTPVTKTAAISWSVRAQVTKTAAVSWSVRSLVAKAAAVSWAVRARVLKTAATAWAVRSRIIKQVAISWSVRAAVAKTAAASWHVRTAVLKTAAAAWSVRVLVAGTLAVPWSVRALVAKTSQVSWDVEADLELTPVARALPVFWNVRAPVARTAALEWSVRSRISRVAEIAWSVRGAALIAVLVVWAVRRSATITAAISWDVESDQVLRDLTLTAAPLVDRFSVDPLPRRFSSELLDVRFAATPGGMMTDIHVSAGEKEYVGGTVTELTRKDITGGTFTIALGTDDVDSPDSGWVTPTVSEEGATSAKRLLMLLVDDSFDLGTFFCWGRVGDSPEVKAILLSGPHRIY